MNASVERLAVRFATEHPLETARRLERTNPREAAAFLASLDPEDAARVMTRMVSRLGASVLEHSDPRRAVDVLSEMPEWEQVRLARHLSRDHLPVLLDALPPGRRDELRVLVAFPRGSAGSVADRQAVVLPADLTVEEALPAMVSSPIPYLYVVDRAHRLEGVIHRRQLASSPPATPLGTLMSRAELRIPARTPVQVAARHVAWRDLDALPVVDRRGRYVGVIRRKNLDEVPSRGSAASSRASLIDALLGLGELLWAGLLPLLLGAPANTSRRVPAKSEEGR